MVGRSRRSRVTCRQKRESCVTAEAASGRMHADSHPGASLIRSRDFPLKCLRIARPMLTWMRKGRRLLRYCSLGGGQGLLMAGWGECICRSGSEGRRRIRLLGAQRELGVSHKPFLGQPVTFKAAYPDFLSLRLIGTQHGEMNSPSQSQVAYSESTIPRVIPCSNPKCRQGGYDLQPFLITLAHSKDLAYEGHICCNGHEGTPKGRVKGDPCFNHLEFKIEATYKERI